MRLTVELDESVTETHCDMCHHLFQTHMCRLFGFLESPRGISQEARHPSCIKNAEQTAHVRDVARSYIGPDEPYRRRLAL